MCGVIGLVYENHHPQLGHIAAELLKTLEYRGYDSTGAAIQGPGTEVALRKGVGAPSVMVRELGIVDLSGSILCGQVRWATFGAVTELNSQPHVVRCKRYLYGAHNGNVTNCDDLKRWLQAEGHAVLSDNDGEMVVHTVEHCFSQELDREAPAAQEDPAARRRAMRAAIVAAAARLQGSYAAVIVDPLTRTMWAIKQGSSLYFGFGRDERGGRFAIASSDLSAVLRLSRVLLPLSEGEFVEFTPAGQQVYAATGRRVKTAEGARAVRAGEALPRTPVRSRLRAKDTALLPGFSSFMEQEIAAQPQALRSLITLFRGGSAALRRLAPHLRDLPAADREALGAALDGLRDLYDEGQLRARFHALVDLPATRRLLGALPAELRRDLASGASGSSSAGPDDELASTEAGLLSDLLPAARDEADRLALRLCDALLEQAEVEELGRLVDRFTATCQAALREGGRLFVICCGSSFHAAKAAALFFNEIAGAPLQPLLPGEFRAEHARSLRDGDVIIAVSQSGETKDLIDVLNQVSAGGRRVARVALVNNLNSTLAQEKCELVLPLRCGPEIAVPATKSFLSQLAVFYCLALRLGERLCAALPAGPERGAREQALRARLDRLPALPAIVAETGAAAEIERAARLLYLRPSLHLLGTRLLCVALEGALKIREVVLNHTEGFEGSEFKHGPNTILGWSTLFGPQELQALLQRVGAAAARVAEAAAQQGLPPPSVGRLVAAVAASALDPGAADAGLGRAEAALLEGALPRAEVQAALHADYPLLYITGPDELDVNLTVSQINTHKIRGAMTLVVAEEHPALRQAAEKAPVDNPRYQHAYVPLPRTGDTLMTVFSATVALQHLALRMSLLKKEHLDRLGMKDHGVHPDVPKNVSKSITVD